MKQTWLTSMLVDKGVMSEGGLTRKAKVLEHRPCHFPTLSGLDSDRCALDAWCDLGQLTLEGEALALLGGRRTYELRGDRLSQRDRWSIPGRPASRCAVFAEHRCHDPIPAAWCIPHRPAPLNARNDDDGIPF
jgi:hypothetical protein